MSSCLRKSTCRFGKTLAVKESAIYLTQDVNVKVIFLVLGGKPPAMPRSPHIRMARWHKTPGELERSIGAESVRTIRQESELCVVCTAGAFIGCVENVKKTNR